MGGGRWWDQEGGRLRVACGEWRLLDGGWVVGSGNGGGYVAGSRVVGE